MKLAFVISPSRVWISSINASPRPCAVPPSIWPWTACGLTALPTSWAVADPDDAREAELDVHLGDDAHGGTANATWTRSPVIWPVSGSSGNVRGWR